MFKLIGSTVKRLVTAATSPIRMKFMQLRRLVNPNVVSAKVVKPLTKNVKSLLTLKPQSKKDYVSILGLWVYKKLFYTIIFIACTVVLILCGTTFATLPSAAAAPKAVVTDVTYRYNDMELAEFTGVANIEDARGNVVYTGDIATGVCAGQGTLYTTDGVLRYKGTFANNQYSGEGVLYYPDGKIEYEGAFKDNLYDGEGRLYDIEQRLVYEGAFSAGAFAGQGKRYFEDGKMRYEGEFLGGRYHGAGVSYTQEGVTQYEGQFLEGVPQGVGTMYNGFGKKVYTGVMYGGEISYPSLIGETLQSLEAAFYETPRIYYTNDSACFFFEQAGVIATADCRVRIDTWERDSAADSDMYIMPDELDDTNLDRRSTITTAARAGITPVAWYADGDEQGSGNTNSDTGNTDNTDSGTNADDGNDPNNNGGSSTASGKQDVEIVETQPEFIDKRLTLFFEIDKDMWQSEAELDKSKLQIKKITIVSPPQTIKTDGLELVDNLPPSLEDCVSIHHLRRATPTAFSNIIFEIDTRNKLFPRIWNISYANKIVRQTYEQNGLIYRYCYPLNEPDALMYYSIES